MRKKILLIGASTGGPSQIKELLQTIQSLSSTIIIMQHMREEILPFFIKDLKESLSINVQSTPLFTDFSKPSIIICKESSVIHKKGAMYEISAESQGQCYTPDINKFLNTFVPYVNDFDTNVLIMTGIGDDGVSGAQKLKEKGAKVFAQDESSSPVYGMPKAAFERGIVDKVKSFDEIKEYFRGL